MIDDGMGDSWLLVIALYGIASMLTFIAYAIDKAAARAGRRRISETTLLLMGLACGWPGALLARRWLRHKSSKAAFQLPLWSTVLINIAALAWLSRHLILSQQARF
ncbi:DUF1294 domain-containing protein [Herbaspirillum sp. RTI4]|uniref:DUF1294 domain-containing protein n=1 Tax=Herbaspirillum sp. RTI4 TaxID=3048640 RepID=UPI002AB49D04|nr:DUF1294 domain-containing protein [Herbaspirillum sp. RTI4]MDY7579237.1 DUF1294 domain-containing protein [Herbaspirillum sp. RTI4]MEA9982630.1 DUF1294 domain-containing protein [Herbaspirillum sp. RTI4]